MTTSYCDTQKALDKASKHFGESAKDSDPKKSNGSSKKKAPEFIQPKPLFTNVVRREFYTRNCRVAHDENKIAYIDLDKEKMIILHPDRKVVIDKVRTREYLWSPNCKYIIYLQMPGTGPLDMMQRNIYVVDVDAGKQRLVYRSKNGNLRGLEWGQDGNHIYTIESVDRGRYNEFRVIRINIRSKAVTVLKKMKKVISFFMPPITGFEYSGKSINEPYKVIIGTPKGFWLADPEGGGSEKILDFSARGCDNSEFDPTGDHIALFFNDFKLPGENAVMGLYVYEPKTKKTHKLYHKPDVHTMWWRPTVEGQTQLITFSNPRTLYGYQYQEATDSQPASYKCVFQIWSGEEPCDLTFQLEPQSVEKKGTSYKVKFKPTVGNAGPGKSPATQLQFLIKGRVKARLNVKELKAKELYSPGKPIEITIEDGQELEIVVGKNLKFEDEVTKKNNSLKVMFPLAPDAKVFRPEQYRPKVVMLQGTSNNDRHTGFWWGKDGYKMVLTAGNRAHMFMLKEVQEEGVTKTKVVCMPVLEAPPGAFFGRPKFFRGRIVVTSYSKAKPRQR